MAGLSTMDDQASLYRSRRQQVIESAEAGDLEAVIIYGNLYAPGAIQPSPASYRDATRISW